MVDIPPIQFEPFINYEAIVCVRVPENGMINAACLGIHFTATNDIYIHAYPESHTHALLVPDTKIEINFAEDFLDYALAAIHQPANEGIIVAEDEIPEARFRNLDHLELKSSWLCVSATVVPFPDPVKFFPQCRRAQNPNIRAHINSIKTIHHPQIFNNRAFNLAIEALIHATRIPLYDSYSEEFDQALKQYKAIREKIINWRDFDRFSSGFEIMDSHLLRHNVKSRDLYSD